MALLGSTHLLVAELTLLAPPVNFLWRIREQSKPPGRRTGLGEVGVASLACSLQ